MRKEIPFLFGENSQEQNRCNGIRHPIARLHIEFGNRFNLNAMSSNHSPSRSRSSNNGVIKYGNEDEKRNCMKKAKKQLSARRLNCFGPNRKQTDDFANYFDSNSYGTMSATTESPTRRRTKQPLAEKDTLLSSPPQQLQMTENGPQHIAQLSELRASVSASDVPKPLKKIAPLKTSKAETPALERSHSESTETTATSRSKVSTASSNESDAERRKQILGKMKSLSARNPETLPSNESGRKPDGIFLAATHDRQKMGETYESGETRRSSLLKTMKRLSSKRLNEQGDQITIHHTAPESAANMPSSKNKTKTKTTTKTVTHPPSFTPTKSAGTVNEKRTKKKKTKIKDNAADITGFEISGSPSRNQGGVEVELIDPTSFNQFDKNYQGSKDPDEVINGEKKNRAAKLKAKKSATKTKSKTKKNESHQQSEPYFQAPAEPTSESRIDADGFDMNLFQDFDHQQSMALDVFGGKGSRIDLLELESDHSIRGLKARDDRLQQAALNSSLPSLGAYFSSHEPVTQNAPRSVQTAPTRQEEKPQDQMLMTVNHEGRPVVFRSMSTPSLFDKPLRPSLKKAAMSSRSARLKKDRTSVQFDKILIREYKRTIGDNPAVSCGPPLGLDWDYNPDEIEVDLEVYETYRPPRRNKDDIVVPPQVRESILVDDWGVPFSEVRKATNETEDIKQMRIESATQTDYQQRMEEVMETTKRRMNRVISGSSKKKEQEHLWSEASHQQSSEVEYPDTFSI